MPKAEALDSSNPMPKAEALDSSNPMPKAKALDSSNPMPKAKALDSSNPMPKAEALDSSNPMPKAEALDSSKMSHLKMSLFSSFTTQSLTRTTLIKMGIRIAMIIITVTVISYWHVISNLELQVVEQLEKYITERGHRDSSLLKLAEANHLTFKNEFLRRYQAMANEDVSASFDQVFEAYDDGIIRMRTQYFHGVELSEGARITGMSGFIQENVAITDDLRRRLIIGHNMVSLYGPIWENRFPDLYLSVPEKAVVVYWPKVIWVPEKNSKVDYFVTDEPFYIGNLEHNSQRDIVWSGIYYEEIGQEWLVSCVTPVDYNGQHIATVGSDILLSDLFEHTINDHLEGTYNIIFQQDGRLIAHPNKMEAIQASGGNLYIQQSPDQNLINIFERVTNRQPGQVVVENPKNDELLAITKIEGPDWYLVTVYPKSLMADLAFNTASVILLLGLISLVIEITVLFWVLRQQVAQPLQKFLGATKQIAQGNFNVEATQNLPLTRGDEIGQLAQSFNTMASQLKTSFDTLEAKNTELQRLDEVKDEFLANTSHELRTPLNGIIGIAESLREGVAGKLSDNVNANLAMIISSGKRLSTLVNDILDFSKLKHKEIELQLKSVGLRELVEVVVTLSQPLVAKKPVELFNTITSDLPPAKADENRLQQILYNLIGNAIKFTEQGKITISANVIENFEATQNSRCLALTVSDTGIGIPEDKQERIFDSFEQVEGGAAREYSGTGLGLAVTKQLVQLHGGKIWVESTPGVGSRFSLTLPISDEAPASQLSVSSEPLSTVQVPVATQVDTLVRQSPVSERLSTPGQDKILIVDDEPVNLQVVANFLSLQHYNIVQATSGLEAIGLIEDGLKPDTILLDVMMPRMTGYEVTKKLREKWQLSELPILLLTAKNQIEDLVTGLEVGANDYLTKPVSKDELLARLKTHLSIKRLREENLRMSAELEVSRRLQQMLLPKEQELRQIDGLDIKGFMEPADEVGGDYYDVLYQDGRVLIGIGDVTGHGLESGALAIMVQSSIRTLLASYQKLDSVKFLSALNQMVYHNVLRMNAEKSLTLALLSYQDGQLCLTGQHEEMIVVRQGEVELIDTLDLGFQIGLEPDITDFVAQTQLSLNPGDVVVLYTDGITEAENTQRQFYELERLCEVIRQNWQQTAQEIREAVINDVRRFIGAQKVYDDITLLVIKQKY
jgi:signal transduction histidine kinase/serine phosphatase RsbU (regulator of sigma subunit)